MTQAQFDLLEEEFAPHLIGNRTESTAMLAWFLENVWREDPAEVEDALCDGSNDLGIDAIVVDHDAREISVIQGKRRRNEANRQGDSDLKALVGVAAYFDSPEAIDGLLASSPNQELEALIERQGIRELLAEEPPYTVNLVFVTNGERAPAATAYIASREGQTPEIELWDRAPLAAVAERTQRPGLVPGNYTLLPDGPVLRRELLDDVEMAVALVPAAELVRLPGIDDFTLFALNVRLSLGRTRINKELSKTITEETAQHRQFPAFHNGLTLLAETLKVDDDGLHLQDISVVNGCQSLVALRANQKSLTPDLALLVKVVTLGSDPSIADTITYRSNNQNPVNIRDQRANDAIQRDLQAQMEAAYGGELFYSIRRGEQSPGNSETLDNQLAAQLIVAIWLQEPWNAVRKLKLFDEDYRRIFHRGIDAYNLRLAYQINKLIEARRGELRPELSASFAAVRFTVAFLIAEVARESELGAELLADPSRWLPEREDDMVAALDEILAHVITELNFYAETRETARAADPTAPAFDPKVAFKNSGSIRTVQHQVMATTKALARRFPDFLFDVEPERN